MSTAALSFAITPEQPNTHLFRVTCHVRRPNAQGQLFSLPSWIPGSYLIREFAKNIVSVRAYSDLQALALTKIDKDTWQCEPCADAITLEYDVYAWDLSIRAAFLDHCQAFFNGTSVFLRVHGLENEPCELHINASKQNVHGDWRVATSLQAIAVDHRGFGRYFAQSYDDLVDHPVHMGEFDDISFDAGGRLHRVFVAGKHRGDLQRLQSDLKTLCSHTIQLFQTKAPFGAYTFLLRVEDDAYGGLEHRASSALLCKRSDLPLAFEKHISDSYRTLLGLFSHEYFHAWNVKRLKPEAFTTYDYNKENYTKLLWFFEGFTSYYDDLLLLRSRLISPASYLELLGRTITSVYRGAGRLKQSVAQSSFDAWIKFYRPDENTPNAVVSYYTKGSLVALALDFTIRKATNDQKSLDDLMRTLWHQYSQGHVSGIDEHHIVHAAESITGISLKVFFDSYVNGTEDLPLIDLFAHFGILCQFRAQEHDKDLGGVSGKKKDDFSNKVYFGAKTKRDENGGLMVSHVEEASPAQRANLAPGDTLIAIDHLRITATNFDSHLIRYQPGEEVQLHAFRRGEMFTTTLSFEKRPANTCYLSIDDNAIDVIAQRREKWFFPLFKP